MAIALTRALPVCILLLAAGATSAHADRERSPGILRELIGEIAPGSPQEAEEQALRARDGSEALRLYGLLQARSLGEPEGVRAALWVGLYYYGIGEEETALEYFEKARKNAGTDDVSARADFWCDQVRLRTGREPLPSEQSSPEGTFGVLQTLARVDRSIREGRRGEAEGELLLVEGDARRAGLLGLCLARWGDILRMPGSGRANREVLAPLSSACAGLPERLRMASAAVPATPAPQETWSIQIGAFLDGENAKRQQEDLRRQGIDLQIVETPEGGRSWFRTRLGEFPSRAEAESAGAALPPEIPHEVIRTR